MQVYFLLNVRLVDEVPMLERDRRRAAEWLKQWTPKNNFEAVITSDMDVAVQAFREDFAKSAATHGYPSRNFEFTIGMSEIEERDGVQRFSHNHELARVVDHNVNAGIPS